MDNAHICQLHYKIAWVHHERPNFYKSLYVVLKILDKEPHFLKCGSRHAGSTSINVLKVEWYSKYYGSSCLALAGKMVTACVWLTSQCMRRYSEKLQVNSSFINWVYYNQGNGKQHLQIWQVISNETNSRSVLRCWWPECQTRVYTLKTTRIGNVISLSINF